MQGQEEVRLLEAIAEQMELAVLNLLVEVSGPDLKRELESSIGLFVIYKMANSGCCYEPCTQGS